MSRLFCYVGILPLRFGANRRVIILFTVGVALGRTYFIMYARRYHSRRGSWRWRENADNAIELSVEAYGCVCLENLLMGRVGC